MSWGVVFSFLLVSDVGFGILVRRAFVGCRIDLGFSVE